MTTIRQKPKTAASANNASLPDQKFLQGHRLTTKIETAESGLHLIIQAEKEGSLRAKKWFATAEEVLSAGEKFWIGQTYRDIKDYPSAYLWIGKAAKAGDAKGQLIFGIMHELGQATEINKNIALLWYFKATRGKLPEAPEYLWKLATKMLISNEAINPTIMKEVLIHLKSAAANNSGPVLAVLGMLHLEGKHLPPDYQLGLSYLIKAVKKDENVILPISQTLNGAQFYSLAIYCHDSNDEESEKLVFKLIQIAVQKDYVVAKFCLAQMYELGIGTSINIEKALKYYKQAASQGFMPALIGLMKLSIQLGKGAIATAYILGEIPEETIPLIELDSNTEGKTEPVSEIKTTPAPVSTIDKTKPKKKKSPKDIIVDLPIADVAVKKSSDPEEKKELTFLPSPEVAKHLNFLDVLLAKVLHLKVTHKKHKTKINEIEKEINDFIPTNDLRFIKANISRLQKKIKTLEDEIDGEHESEFTKEDVSLTHSLDKKTDADDIIYHTDAPRKLHSSSLTNNVTKRTMKLERMLNLLREVVEAIEKKEKPYTEKTLFYAVLGVLGETFRTLSGFPINHHLSDERAWQCSQHIFHTNVPYLFEHALKELLQLPALLLKQIEKQRTLTGETKSAIFLTATSGSFFEKMLTIKKVKDEKYSATKQHVNEFIHGIKSESLVGDNIILLARLGAYSRLKKGALLRHFISNQHHPLAAISRFSLAEIENEEESPDLQEDFFVPTPPTFSTSNSSSSSSSSSSSAVGSISMSHEPTFFSSPSGRSVSSLSSSSKSTLK